jgi:histidine triad (HIT) family protein
MDCIFCKIVGGQIPAKKLFENDLLLAFENIKPVHPVHVLIIPKKHIDNVQSARREDKDWLAEMLLAVPDIAQKKGVDKSGYRLIINYGKDSGQSVEHLHIHLVGGEELPFATG